MSVCQKVGIGLILLMVGGWLWIGFDKIVGDHEVGVLWEPFIKSEPTWTLYFDNPARRGLDIDAYVTLDARRRQDFVRYCRVRHGTSDVFLCEKIIAARLH
ncbi:hypothetical protein DYQ93_19420 [Xanthomonas sp. LMG 8992]|uniref:hypothetical protein n=1 Tax=Xanthomonas sp. LMG 8992 TaxID=1591157 RepID=UPI00136FA75D|nr:hypothetical protein [Xanthomonas sp. LMG 8992]MXV13179.1 hypothetical protein [Xanthomonas sp. LMG 8992]